VAEFVDVLGPMVFSLCYRMLGQRQDAEDVSQETFVRAIRSLDQWDAGRPIEPWLLTIAANRCRSALARRKNRPASESLVEILADQRPCGHAAQDLAEEVQQALLKVRPEYRQAFLLFHECEMSYAEISQSMDSPLGTIKTWVHRARKQLIGELQSRDVLGGSPSAVRRV